MSALSVLSFAGAFFSTRLSFCQTNKASRFPSELHFSKLLFSKSFINLAADGLGGPGLPPSAGVYGIRYAWNTFDLTEGFSHVFPTVTKVCGFKQILWVCARLLVCTSCAVSVCVRAARRCVTDLKYSPIICRGMWSPEMERGEGQRKMRNNDERMRGNNNWSLGQRWRVPAVLGGPLNKENRPSLLCGKHFTFWLWSLKISY